MTTTYGTCGKCDGKGHIDAFSHIANGVCFWCKGTGQLPTGHEYAVDPTYVSPDLYSVTLGGKTAAAWSRGEGHWEVQLTNGAAHVFNLREISLSDGLVRQISTPEGRQCQWGAKMKRAILAAVRNPVKVTTPGQRFDIQAAYYD